MRNEDSELWCRKGRFYLLPMLLAALLQGGCLGLPSPGSWQEAPVEYWDWFRGMTNKNSSFLLLAIAILPGFGFPVSPLLVLCGSLTAKTGSWVAAWLLTSAAMWTNAAWTYLFAVGPGRKFAKGFLDKFNNKGIKVPQVEGYQLALILRVTPGIPLPVQNYLMGVTGVSAKVYWGVSFPVLSLWSLGFVRFGEGLLEGDSKLIITGIGLLVVISVIARIVYARFTKKSPPVDPPIT